MDRLRHDACRRLWRSQRTCAVWTLVLHWLFHFERRPGKRRPGGHPANARRPQRCRRHLVVSDDRLVGMMNVHSLNSVPREEWAHNSVQAAMIPREKILWTSPEEPLLRLLERLLTADVNQMPVVSGADDGAPQIVGIVTRDSILRVMQTRSEVGSLVA